MSSSSWYARLAWLPGGWARDVTIEVAAGRFAVVAAGSRRSADAVELPGVVVPGLADAHSHAFHRALRGRAQDAKGSFWTWRDAMFAVADRLDPDLYLALARATYAEMALAGVSSVGEFHYLHHAEAGKPYADPNAMGAALVEAASQAGVRLTLLDTCYLAGGLRGSGHMPLSPVQQRFADADVEQWAERVQRVKPADNLVVGAAVHSVRAVPAPAIALVAEAAKGRPLHAHLSEQPAENVACRQFYGMSPAQLLARHGVLGQSATVVHATHLSPADIGVLAGSGTGVCLCPTTERDLADGTGPARQLADAGVPLCLGSDQHVTSDLLGEAQALEMDERLASGERGRFGIDELLAALTVVGHRSLGWPDCGELRVGARADLVALRMDTARTAGSAPEQAVVVAGATDVDTVVIGGETVVEGGRHFLGDVGRQLAAAIAPIWEGAGSAGGRR
jgi:formiminoglutamate deiminase